MPCSQLATIGLGIAVYSRGDVAGLTLAVISVSLGFALQASVLLRFYSRAHASRIGILGYHLGCILVGLMMIEGALDLLRRRPIRWGGREYVLEPR